MARTTVFDIERLRKMERETVVGGTIDAQGNLLLSRKGGDTVNAGPVRGAQGTKGDPGAKGETGPQGLEGLPGVAPVGAIMLFPGATPPSGWAICNGGSGRRDVFLELFAIIGTTYGEGNAPGTTFSFPNFQGRVAVGFAASLTDFNAVGKTGGVKDHNHQHIAEIALSNGQPYILDPEDNSFNLIGSDDVNVIRNAYVAPSGAAKFVGSVEVHTKNSSRSNNLQPYITINYIIKTSSGR